MENLELTKNETDLAKAQRFAISLEDFKQLIRGDLKASINFLMAIDHHENVKELLMEEMYKLYCESMEKKGKEESNGNGSDNS